MCQALSDLGGVTGRKDKNTSGFHNTPSNLVDTRRRRAYADQLGIGKYLPYFGASAFNTTPASRNVRATAAAIAGAPGVSP